MQKISIGIGGLIRSEIVRRVEKTGGDFSGENEKIPIFSRRS